MPALADGDPASDVLATQPLFLPQDGNVPAVQQAELSALLQSAAQSGYRLRVALVASAVDLGSVTELWRQPESYARFLGQELSLVYRGPLLVVMPNGVGLYGVGGALAADQALLDTLRSPPRVGGIGAVALAAIERLASAAGHPLPAPAATVPSASAPGDLGGWIALAVGALLVAIAWGASFRVRPPHLPGRAARGG